MNTIYYLIEASEYPNYENSLDQGVAWKLDRSQCLIEVAVDFTVSPYVNSWDNSGDFKLWRNQDANWPDWETEAFHNGTDPEYF